MSKFLSQKFSGLAPYVPGEQPKERKYIKLNTNESPFKPSRTAIKLSNKASKGVQLYSDPECKALIKEFIAYSGVKENQVLFTNGSDEILNFAFMAFCDKEKGAMFPDITYGFYQVFASLYGIDYKKVPLKEDFSIQVEDYFNAGRTIFIANPNAPTGLNLSLDEIEQILKENTDSVVVIDEAYVDFGGESAIKLINKYDNLLVTQTFSKSRSMAGARLGVGIANQKLIEDLVKIKYSQNPYNVNAITMAMGIGSLRDKKYFIDNCEKIKANRHYISEELKKLGFTLTDSSANFVFCKSDKISGEELNKKLKEKGILVRHFSGERICEYNRITVGSKTQMQALIKAIKEILEETK